MLCYPVFFYPSSLVPYSTADKSTVRRVPILTANSPSSSTRLCATLRQSSKVMPARLVDHPSDPESKPKTTSLDSISLHLFVSFLLLLFVSFLSPLLLLRILFTIHYPVKLLRALQPRTRIHLVRRPSFFLPSAAPPASLIPELFSEGALLLQLSTPQHNKSPDPVNVSSSNPFRFTRYTATSQHTLYDSTSDTE
jgi:hypothetical protein